MQGLATLSVWDRALSSAPVALLALAILFSALRLVLPTAISALLLVGVTVVQVRGPGESRDNSRDNVTHFDT